MILTNLQIQTDVYHYCRLKSRRVLIPDWFSDCGETKWVRLSTRTIVVATDFAYNEIFIARKSGISSLVGENSDFNR